MDVMIRLNEYGRNVVGVMRSAGLVWGLFFVVGSVEVSKFGIRVSSRNFGEIGSSKQVYG